MKHLNLTFAILCLTTLHAWAQLEVSITDSVAATCGGSADGSLTATATGGTEPYSYQWDDPMNQVTATAIGLAEW